MEGIMRTNEIIKQVDLVVVITGDDKNTSFLGVNEYMGIGYIKSYLESNGIQTNINILQNVQTEYIKQKFEQTPQFIGLCMYSDNVHEVIEAANCFKSLYPTVKIAVGGPQVNNFEEQILKDNTCFDMVTSYEAEETFLEIVERINNRKSLQGCLGVTYRDNGKIIRNPFRSPIVDLDSLPFPSRYIHEHNSQQYLYLTGSRGCLGGCSFCGETSAKKDIGRPFIRLRSPKSVVDEMEGLVNKYKMHAFRFTDATFEDTNDGTGIQRAETIYDEIISRNLHVSLHLFTRAEIVDKAPASYYQKAKKAGVECFYVGIESGSSEDIQLYNKRTTIEKNHKAIKVIRDSGIHVGIGFINFNPFSTFSTIKHNIDFLHESGFGHVFYLAQTRLELLPQSYLIKQLQKDGLIIGDFDYKSHFYNYYFKDNKMYQLYLLFKKAYTASPIYFMDTLSGMNRVFANNNQDNKNIGKIMHHFTELDDVCRKYDDINYKFANKAIDMCANGATQDQLDKLLEQTNLNGIYDEYLSLYNLTNLRVVKERLAKIL
ncbi:MAG TPA: hypothetical protein DC000_10145 [Clostridiales bacterium]|nr:hypothetical protein [Clostridiales bacterium]